MKIIKRIDYNRLPEIFGSPGTDDSYFVKKRFPFPMYASWDKGLKLNNFYGNKYIADAVIEALEEIYNYFGHEGVKKYSLDSWGGCVSIRKSRGSEKWSTHAWGMAVDYCPEIGQYGMPSAMPHVIVEAFTRRGFEWGGNWSYKDGMHFTAVNE